MLDIIVTGVIVGVSGTIAMDVFNHLFARTGLISKIDVGMLGRMAAGWVHGRFFYHHPSEVEQVANEKSYGYVTHYSIGVGLAVPFVLGWDLMVGVWPASPAWTLAYGVATTIASWFFVYPSLGLGMFGLRSPEGIRNTFTSLANHIFFGIGMAVAVTLM